MNQSLARIAHIVFILDYEVKLGRILMWLLCKRDRQVYHIKTEDIYRLYSYLVRAPSVNSSR